MSYISVLWGLCVRALKFLKRWSKELDSGCPAQSSHLVAYWGSHVPLWILGLSPCLYSELLCGGSTP